MAGCNECKFKDSKLNWNDDGTLGKTTFSCKSGNTENSIKWWSDNGKKNSYLDDMPCHEYNDSTKILISCNEKVSELLEILENKAV